MIPGNKVHSRSTPSERNMKEKSKQVHHWPNPTRRHRRHNPAATGGENEGQQDHWRKMAAKGNRESTEGRLVLVTTFGVEVNTVTAIWPLVTCFTLIALGWQNNFEENYLEVLDEQISWTTNPGQRESTTHTRTGHYESSTIKRFWRRSDNHGNATPLQNK